MKKKKKELEYFDLKTKTKTNTFSLHWIVRVNKIRIEQLHPFPQKQLDKILAKYKNNKEIMKNKEIRKKWKDFINNPKYKKYIQSNEELWNDNLSQLINYIKKNNKKPSQYDKNKEIKSLGKWICHQIQNYKKTIRIMKNSAIKKKWENFITKYQKYFPKNPAIQDDYQSDSDYEDSSSYKDSDNETNSDEDSDLESDDEIPKKTNTKSVYKSKELSSTSNTKTSNTKFTPSSYQKLGRKMSTQKSTTTRKMFQEDKTLWHQYHDHRDTSFQGYKEQEQLPINMIAKMLEQRKKHKLKILDLGCGRNHFYNRYKEHKNFKITGYDYISYNESKVADISELPEEDDTVDICIFSQSLMGYNWKDYLKEAYRVLRYHGEIIVCETSEKYQDVLDTCEKLGFVKMKEISSDSGDKENRWFYLTMVKK